MENSESFAVVSRAHPVRQGIVLQSMVSVAGAGDFVNNLSPASFAAFNDRPHAGQGDDFLRPGTNGSNSGFEQRCRIVIEVFNELRTGINNKDIAEFTPISGKLCLRPAAACQTGGWPGVGGSGKFGIG